MLKKLIPMTLLITTSSFGFIIGGLPVFTNTQFPFVAKISNDCAGTIINKRWVLTAAHCKMGINYITAGEIDLSKIKQGNVQAYAQQINVDSRIEHPDFKKVRVGDFNSAQNDFLLIRLSENLDLNQPNVSKISIASNSLSDQYLVQNESFKILGWGSSDLSGYGESDRLQMLEIPFVPYALSNSVDSYNGAITPQNMFTAGFMEGGKDACHGDSGGPLFKNINGENVLFGVISGGKGCAQRNKPGVYAKVSSTTDWIKKMIESEYLCEAQGHRINILLQDRDGKEEAQVKIDNSPMSYYVLYKNSRGLKKYRNNNGPDLSIAADGNMKLNIDRSTFYNCILNQSKMD